MTQIKCWKDDDGYAFQFEDSRLELSADGLDEFINQLSTLQQTIIESGEALAVEFCVDLEELEEED